MILFLLVSKISSLCGRALSPTNPPPLFLPSSSPPPSPPPELSILQVLLRLAQHLLSLRNFAGAKTYFRHASASPVFPKEPCVSHTEAEVFRKETRSRPVTALLAARAVKRSPRTPAMPRLFPGARLLARASSLRVCQNKPECLATEPCHPRKEAW